MSEIIYKSLKETELVAPTVLSVDNQRFELSNKLLVKRFNEGMGFPSTLFSNTLYKLNQSMWNQMKEQLSKSEDVDEFKNSKTAVISENNEVIGVVGSSRLDDLLSKVKELSQKLNGEESHEYFNNWLFITITTPEDTGLIIVYYPDWDWLSIRSFVKIESDNKEIMYIHPYTIVSTEMDDYDFDEFLNYDTIITHLDKEVIIKYHFDEFLKIAKLADISVGEMKRLLKNDFGIKYQEGLSAFDIAAEDDDFDASATSMLTNILSSLDRYQKIALFSPELKKEITFSTPVFEYYLLLSNLASKSVKYYESLWNFTEQVMSNKLNYSQLNESEEIK